jgi:hypothetical protein
MRYPPVESVKDFKARIAALVRQQTGEPEVIEGAKRSHPCVVRKEKTYGYNAWDKTKGKRK